MPKSVSYLLLLATLVSANAANEIAEPATQESTTVTEIPWETLFKELNKANIFIGKLPGLIKSRGFCDKPITVNTVTSDNKVDSTVSVSFIDPLTKTELKLSPFTLEIIKTEDAVVTAELKSPFFEQFGLKCSAVLSKDKASFNIDGCKERVAPVLERAGITV